MIIPRLLSDRYSELVKYLNLLGDEVNETINNIFANKCYPIISRVKGIESLAEKIETGRFSSIEEIDDLFACTIIIPTLLDESEIIETLRKKFFIVEVRERNSGQKSPTEFRFDNTRLICKLCNPEGFDNPKYNLKFEVQIKTALEYAWSVSTHSVTYKADEISWKKKRLASQIKAQIEQLDMLLYNFEATSSVLDSSPYNLIDKQNDFLEMIKQLFESKYLPRELRPKDLSRLAENFIEFVKINKLLDNTKYNLLLDTIMYRIMEDHSKNRVPYSITLFQYLVIITAEKNTLKNPERYTYNITPEMEAIDQGDYLVPVRKRFEY